MTGFSALTDWLSGKKTNVVASGAFVATLAGWLNGVVDTDWATLYTLIAAIGATLRAAIAKIQVDLDAYAKGPTK